MGRKDVLKGIKVFDAIDLSGDTTSDWLDVKQVDVANGSLEWSGTSPVGTFIVEAANLDDKSDVFPVDMGSAISVSGNSGSHQLQFTSMPGHFIRFRYDATSGSGTLEFVFAAKMIGG